MFYVFNKDNKCVATSNNRLNEEDLKSRGEFVVESDLDIKCIEAHLIEGVVVFKEATIDKDTRVAILESKYKAEVSKLASEWNIANMDGDTEAIEIIKLERAQLKEKFEADRAVILAEPN